MSWKARPLLRIRYGHSSRIGNFDIKTNRKQPTVFDFPQIRQRHRGAGSATGQLKNPDQLWRFPYFLALRGSSAELT